MDQVRIMQVILAGGLLFAASVANAQDVPSLRQKYSECLSKLTEVYRVHGKELPEGGKLYCACLNGAGAFGQVTGNFKVPNGGLERIVDLCHDAFESPAR